MHFIKSFFLLFLFCSFSLSAQENASNFSEEKNDAISLIQNYDLNKNQSSILIKDLNSLTNTDLPPNIFDKKAALINNSSPSGSTLVTNESNQNHQPSRTLFAHNLLTLDKLKSTGLIDQKTYEESVKLVLSENDKLIIVPDYFNESKDLYKKKITHYSLLTLQILGSFFLFITFIYFINSLFSNIYWGYKFPKIILQLPILCGFVFLSFQNQFLTDTYFQFHITATFAFLSVFTLGWIIYSYNVLYKNVYFIIFNSLLLSVYFCSLSLYHQSYLFGSLATIYIGFFFSFLISNAPILKDVQHSKILKSFVLGHFIALAFYFFLILSNHHLIIDHLPKINYFIYGFQYYCPILISAGLLFLSCPFLQEKGQQTSLLSSVIFSLVSLGFICFGFALFYLFKLTLTPSIIAVFSFLFALSWLSYIAYHTGYLIGTILLGIGIYLSIQYLYPFYPLLNFML